VGGVREWKTWGGKNTTNEHLRAANGKNRRRKNRKGVYSSKDRTYRFRVSVGKFKQESLSNPRRGWQSKRGHWAKREIVLVGLKGKNRGSFGKDKWGGGGAKRLKAENTTVKQGKGVSEKVPTEGRATLQGMGGKY